jgi:hypothetical protein
MKLARDFIWERSIHEISSIRYADTELASVLFFSFRPAHSILDASVYYRVHHRTIFLLVRSTKVPQTKWTQLLMQYFTESDDKLERIGRFI